MKLTIHRGSNQIGGSCVEVATDTTRILLDIGLPLDSVGKSKKELNEAYEKAKAQAADWCQGVDAVFISQYHGDHIGLIDAVPVTTSVYMSAPAIRTYVLPQVLFSYVRERNLKPFFRKTIIGDLTITPFRVDHSAYGAQAFLISDGSKTIFYSGDVRTHGLAEGKYRLPKGIDYLMIEGTNIDREYKTGLWSEADVRDKFVESFHRELGIHYVWVSALNIDRLKVLYAACAATGKTLAVDTYTMHILRTMNKKDKSVPFGDDYSALRTFCPEYLAAHFVRQCKTGIRDSVSAWEILLDEVKAAPHDYVVTVRPRMEPEIDFIGVDTGIFVNSMWQEYENLDRYPDNCTFIECVARYKHRHIHTSGHANRKGLLEIADRISPKHIIPIHTDNPAAFKDLFADYEIVMLNDGEARIL